MLTQYRECDGFDKSTTLAMLVKATPLPTVTGAL
jgi:hypothetical protein